jgi:hypothetical protein
MSIKKYNGRTAKIFNRDIKKTGFVTFEDIENVAKTDEDNFFFYNNFFNFISVSNINGVARSTFLFFSGLTENIQEAFIGIRTMLLGVRSDVDVIKNQNTTFRTDITNLQNNKADITYVDGKILILDNNKANKSYVDNEILILKNGKADITFLNSRITTLKNEILGGASSAYDTLLEIQNILQDNTKTNELLTLINQKANQTSLNTTNTNVSTLSNNIINLQNLKADITFVNNSISTLKTELSNNITNLQNGKADITFVNNTTTTLKNELSSDIINLQAVKADISFVNNKITTLKSEILGGASSAYDTLLEIQQFLQNDASQIQALINLVSQKANQSSLDITNNNLSVLSGNCLNISYLDGKTTINNNLKTLDIESNLIQSSNISSNTININKINTDKIYSNHLKTGKLYCFSLNSDFIEYKNDVGIHLYINNLHFPIMRSQNNFSSIYSEPITNLKLTIKPNYTLELYNSQERLYQYTNTTDDFKYYLNIDKYNFTYLKIYLNYILLD